MKTMNKKIYVKPQMELLEDAVTMILAVSGQSGQSGQSDQSQQLGTNIVGARQQDMSNFDFDEEEE